MLRGDFERHNIARNKSYENVLTICHAGIEAVPWQLVFLECFAIAVFD